MDFILANIGQNKVNLQVPEPVLPIVHIDDVHFEDLQLLYNNLKKHKVVVKKSTMQEVASFIECLESLSKIKINVPLIQHLDNEFEKAITEQGLNRKKYSKEEFLKQITSNDSTIDDIAVQIISHIIGKSIVCIDLDQMTRAQSVRDCSNLIVIIRERNKLYVKESTLTDICSIIKKHFNLVSESKLLLEKFNKIKGIAKLLDISIYNKEAKAPYTKVALINNILQHFMEKKLI